MNWKDPIARKAYFAAHMRAWREKYPERDKAQQKTWRENHPEYHKKYMKKWRKENPRKAAAIAKRCREAHKAEHMARTKIWLANHPGYGTSSKQRWRKKNSAKYVSYWHAYNTKISQILSDGFVTARLGFKVGQCPKILLETKRIQLMLHRAAKG